MNIAMEIALTVILGIATAYVEFWKRFGEALDGFEILGVIGEILSR